MNYELKSADPQGLPYNKKTDPMNPLSPVVYGINVIVKTGIVGQAYNGFTNTDLGFCPILETDTIDQIQVKIQAYATNYVTTKYPNT